MAKAIPEKKKSAPRKKHSLKQMTQKELDREINKLLNEYDEITDERFEFAKKILKKQPKEVSELVERLLPVMKKMAGNPSARVKIRNEWVNVRVPEMFQDRNYTYIIIRLLLACAKMDIQVAKFREPKACAEIDCGKKVGK